MTPRPSIFPRARRPLSACLAAAALVVLAHAAWADDGDGAPPPAGMLADGYRPAEQPGFFTGDGSAYGESIAEKRGIEFDSGEVHDEQTRLLRLQNAGAGEALFTATNRFTETIDRWHANTFRWLDNTIRTLDLRWSSGNTNYNPEISTFALALFARAGGRGDDGDFDAKARFRAGLALPGLERRLKLVADNLGRDELPGTDPMKRESDLRVGVQAKLDSFFGERWDLGGGARWHDKHPVGYVDLEWHWSHDLFGGILRFAPRGVWYSDDGFGEDAALVWTGPRTGRVVWQLLSAETAKESTSGIHLEETVRLAVPMHAPGSGWLFQASMFPHLHEEDHTNFDDFVVNATWRAPLYRRWIYYHVTPQVDFADEDGHDPKPSLRFGCEILFGREPDELL